MSPKCICVAEKPSIAKNVAQFLSNNQMRSIGQGGQNTNPIWQFEWQWGNQTWDIIFTSVRGHLTNIDFPVTHKSWTGCNPEVLFEAPIVSSVSTNLETIARNITNHARNAQRVVIWTDCDREGEAIGLEVVELIQKVNARIEVKRARFSVLQSAPVKQAMTNLVELDRWQAYAVQARMEMDLRTGAALTRFQSLTLQTAFRDELTNVVSYGPCQFPTLGFIVDQYRRVRNFTSEPFSKIEVEMDRDNQRIVFNWARNHLFDQEVCLAIYEACEEEPTATVMKMEQRPKPRWKPLPLTTIEMTKAASINLRMSSDHAMEVAERLYTQGYISYPRTETDMFENGFDLWSPIRNLTQDPDFGEYANRLLNNDEFQRPRNGKKNDQAHPPIHPVKDGSNLQGEDRRLFDYIARRYLACCSKNAECQETTVEIDIAQERFSATGLIIQERNFMEVFPWARSAGNERELPNFRQGETFVPRMRLHASQTSPPNHLTEAQLITLMDKSGIGTDATIPEHIKKMLERKYATKDGQKFLPTTLGYALIEGYEAMGFGYDISLGKPYLRASFETDLKKLCNGTINKEQLVQQYIAMYRNVYQQVTQQANQLIQAISRHMGLNMPQNQVVLPLRQVEAPKHVKPCACRASMVLKQTSTGKWMVSCTNYPGCKNVHWFPDNLVSDVSVLQERCTRHGQVDWFKLRVVFLPNKAPAYMYPDWNCCLDCDPDLNDLFAQFRPRPPPNAPPRPAPAAPAPRQNQWNNRQEWPRQDNPVQGDSNSLNCSCGQAATLLTVKKEGPNQGKQFYKCSTGNCQFFEWKDQANAPTATRGRGNARGSRGGNRSRGRGYGKTRGSSRGKSNFRAKSARARGRGRGNKYQAAPQPPNDPTGEEYDYGDDYEMEEDY